MGFNSGFKGLTF